MSEILPGLVIVYALINEMRHFRHKALEARVRRMDAELQELAKYVLSLRPGGR